MLLDELVQLAHLLQVVIIAHPLSLDDPPELVHLLSLCSQPPIGGVVAICQKIQRGPVTWAWFATQRLLHHTRPLKFQLAFWNLVFLLIVLLFQDNPIVF
jgi:hypothetical protein